MQRRGATLVASAAVAILLLVVSATGQETNGDDKGGLKDYQKVEYKVEATTGLPSKDFVRASGKKFQIGGCSDFVFSGFNVWQALELASNRQVNRGNPKPGRAHLSNIFNEASKSGLKVLRIWAHTIINGDGALQPSPGQYNEEIFQGMDWINDQAAKHRLKIIWIFSDNWYEVGGVKQYEKWAGGDFYSGKAKALYKNNIKAILNRKNSINGKQYKNDPTIMAWNIANELRCKDCPSSKMQSWITEMCSFVKGIDGNHMVGIGQEGFHGPDSGLTDANPRPWAQNEGQNFIQNHQTWCIDYVGFHIWPDNWEFETTEFQKKFINTAIEKAAEKIDKPVIMEEFGKIGGDRDKFYRSAFEEVETSVKNNGNLRGVLFYHWYDRGVGPGKYGVWSSSSTFGIIKKNAQLMKSYSKC